MTFKYKYPSHRGSSSLQVVARHQIRFKTSKPRGKRNIFEKERRGGGNIIQCRVLPFLLLWRLTDEKKKKKERKKGSAAVCERTSPMAHFREGQEEVSRRPIQWLCKETSNKEKLRRWREVTNVPCPRLQKILHLVPSLVLFVHEKRRRRRRKRRG